MQKKFIVYFITAMTTGLLQASQPNTTTKELTIDGDLLARFNEYTPVSNYQEHTPVSNYQPSRDATGSAIAEVTTQNGTSPVSLFPIPTSPVLRAPTCSPAPFDFTALNLAIAREFPAVIEEQNKADEQNLSSQELKERFKEQRLERLAWAAIIWAEERDLKHTEKSR